MNTKTMFLGLGALVLVGAAGFFIYSRSHTATGPTPDVVNLAQSGATETQLIDAVDQAKSTKRLTSDDVIALHKAHVSDQVIISLIQKNSAKELATK